jgi:NADH-quinone oxidoreductase subunit L
MPATFALMWVATLAIAGVPPFAGFFSKDQILGAVFERAHGSQLAGVRLFGVPGSAWLYLVYGIGLVTALLTAVYMTRMMLYTFHGVNRTGAGERDRLREAPAVMTGPVAALGVLTVLGGLLNVPAFVHHLVPVGPLAALDRWLAPVTTGTLARYGVAPLAEAATPAASTEAALLGAAVAVAALGIGLAVALLKPAALAPKDEYRAPESGLERTLRHAYYVDEALDRGVARPLGTFSRVVLWRGVDVGLIDGALVRGTGLAARALAWVGSRAQTGRVGNYAWVVAVGAVVVIGAVALRR